jgi:acyl-CoA synthetase (NDP forming)
MLNPRSVAVVGASERMGYGGRVLSNLKQGGYTGRIYPVNPKYDEIQGLKAYPSASAIPDPVDLAVIVVPSDRVAGVVDDCGRAGIPAAAIVTAGFAEEGEDGLALQREVVATARRHGIRLSGPNCLGIANLPGRVFAAATSAATWSRESREMVSGPISIVSQSGALAFSPLLARSQERGVGLRHLISVGNQCDLTLTDFVEYLVDEDPGTKVIGVFMESLPPGDGARFLAVARRAVEKGKPLLVLKAARSSASAAVARSHTAAVTGDGAVYEGAFRQGAVVPVADLDDLWETGSLLAAVPELPADAGIGFLSPSGGMNSLFTDLCSDSDVPLRPLTADTTAGIAEILEGRGHAGNPTDASGQLARPSLRRILKLLEDDPAVDLVTIGLTQTASGERSLVTAGHILQAFAERSVPYAVVWASATTLDGEPTTEVAGIRRVQAAGIPVFAQPAAAARALGRLRRRTAECAVVREDAAARDEDAAPAVIGAGQAAALAALAAAGIPAARTEAAHSLDDALAAADAIGYPVVLKLEAPGLLHKTEVGGVRLDIGGPEALATAYDELLDATASVGDDRHVLVQQQVAGGMELLLGGLVDPAFGPTVTVGLGGTWVEIIGDSSSRVAPVSPRMARAMVDELRAAPVLAGLRTGRPFDVEALTGAIARFSRLVAGLGDSVSEIEVNPLLVLPAGEGVRAVDALVVHAAADVRVAAAG